MNKPKLMKNQGNKMRKPKDWHKKLQGGYREKKKKKEELPKKHPKRQKKMLGMKKKKRKESLMRSYRSKKQRGQS